MQTKCFGKRDIVYLIFIILLTASTVVTSILLFTKKQEFNPTYYEKKCAMFELENANFSHGQIVFIGDSITDGCALDNYYYDLPLATYNRGIGGDNTSGVLNRLKTSLFDIKPSKVVMMIGINDINGCMSKEKILNNYEKILTQISNNLPTAKVFCMSILPINKTLENYTPINVEQSTSIILQVNPEIEKLANRFNYTFVNLFPSFCNSNNLLKDNLTPDGIHLNNEGYIVYSNQLKPLLI